MGGNAPDWSRIHQSKKLGFWSLPLAFFSIPYGLGSRFRKWSYDVGIFEKKSLPGLVISIGNLTVGGTGKTPAVAMLARWALGSGHRAAILSRGYGGKYSEKVLEVSDGNSIKAAPMDTGDEPYLLAKRLSGVPIIISKNRYHAGLFAHEKFGCNFFILDDGFQHMALKRDLDIVLIDAENPFGNGHLLPWGPLREPVSQLARADAFIITRVSQHGSGAMDFVMKKFSSIPIFYSDHRPSKIVFPHSNRAHNPEFINGKPVLAFAGIARPELFKDTLAGLGADVVYFRAFRDHYPFRPEDIQALIQIKKRVGAQYILTTEKDWVRISPLKMIFPEIAYLAIEFVVLPDQDGFFKIIKDVVYKERKLLL
jgi:tetraacyldisaccharide 4'-kinase